MGQLKRFNLDRMIRQSGASYFFETGTWKGDGLAFASRFPFTRLFSSEMMASVATTAQERFRDDKRITVINDISTNALTRFLPEIKGNCIFWLDAHYPGAEEGLKGYNDEEDEYIKLPLQKELELIVSRKAGFQDVLIIDDLRIYEEGNFRNGNLPKDVLPPKVRNTHFVQQLFGDTHTIKRLYEDEGYLLLLPKELKKLTLPEQVFFRVYNLARRMIA